MREMKNSGIEWIGKIPNNWMVIRIKDKYRFETGFTPDTSHQEYYDSCEGFEWATISDIQLGKVAATKSRITPAYVSSKRPNSVPPGSLLYTFKLSIGQVAQTDREIYTNEAIASFAPDCNPNLGYLKYSSILIENNANINIYGARILNQQLINDAYATFPPLSEQTRIATFLDTKCSEIDALMADIQVQIETLEQYKRSVIIEAVTKGLDSKVEMKDSGIEWIGNIPSHWDIHPVGCYFGERKRKNRLGEESNLLSLSYGRVIRKDINANGGLLPESFNTYNIVEENDIIIRPTDLQNDKRSLRTGLVREHGIITAAYICLYPLITLDSRYFHYLLHSYDVMKVFYNMGNGVRQGLNYSEFAKLMIFAPSYEEQIAIADFLEQKTSEADALIAAKKKEIETLEAYKKSLIYEYVTGKKEVV